MRIGIFSQWYDPEPGPAATTGVMARALGARGHEVHVLTGFPNYPSGAIMNGYRQRAVMRETLEGVNIVRVPLYPSHDGSALRRMANYASFGLSAAALGVPALPPMDVLWVNYSPITLALPMWLQQALRRTPTVCEVADLWPDTLSVAGLQGAGAVARWGRGALDRWCEAMYASSQAVVHISPGVGDVLESRGVPAERLHYIPKSADESVFHPNGRSQRAALGIDEDATVLLYAGAMGAAQGLESLLDACALVDDPRIVVLLAGSGTREHALRQQAVTLGLGNVRFLGRVPQEDMTDLLATADLGYVSLARHATSAITMPSKTQSILAVGRPILAAADGDVADLVEAHDVGFTARSGEADAIAEGLRAALARGRRELGAMGGRARHLYESEFSVGRLASQTEELLLSVASTQRRDRQGVSGVAPGGSR